MSKVSKSLANIWSHIILDTCVQHQLSAVFVAPGSRSTPLVFAVSELNIPVFTHIDERGLAFAALGYAKAVRLPVAVVVTSGTAVANLLPAVIEAFYSAVPLVILTADRPAFMRNSGANQTIDQRNIFKDFVAKQLFLPLPTEQFSPKWVQKQIQDVMHAGLEKQPGPVHINCEFDEPGLNDSDADFEAYFARYSSQIAGVMQGRLNFDFNQKEVLKQFIDSHSNIAIFVGGGVCNSTCILEFAQKYNLPVFADITSGLRLVKHALLFHYYDRFLDSGNDDFFNQFDGLLIFGGAFVSKSLLGSIGQFSGHILQVVENGLHWDPSLKGYPVLHAKVSEIIAWLMTSSFNCILTSHFELSVMTAQFESVLANAVPVSVNEIWIIRTLSQLLQSNHHLFISNSLPIRLMDAFASAGEGAAVYANRGASGIDGILASAAGVALATQETVFCLLGDMAFMHDLASLALISQQNLKLCIVLIDNNGGGIFSHLPIASEETVFKPYFQMPVDGMFHFKHAAKMVGLSYLEVDTCESFSNAITAFPDLGKSQIIYLKCEEDETVSLFKNIRIALRSQKLQEEIKL